jgi:hypothetical protein
MLSFNVHGVSIQVNSPIQEFIEFVCSNYASFDSADDETADVTVTYSKKAGEYAVEQKSGFRFFGEGIYLGDNKLYWENQYGFRVLLSPQDDGTVSVHSFHHDLLGKSDEEERLKDFQRSMRWAIHFPLFTQLQYRRGWLLVHASAVVKDGSAVAFCGLNRVGKSTLAVYLAEEYGYELMTDNFLFVGDNTLYGFPEVLRLSPDAAKHMQLGSLWDNLVYGKYHIDPDQFGIELKATPERFFFVNRGSNLQTRKINPTSTLSTIENLHSYLGEFPEHSYLGMWPYLTGETMNSEPAYDTMTSTPWYELSYEQNWKLDAVVEEVELCI